jgi:hypothetical protein
MGDRAPIQARKAFRLLARKARAHETLVPWELLRPIKAKREGEAKHARLSHGEASRPKERLDKGLPIRKKSERATRAA